MIVPCRQYPTAVAHQLFKLIRRDGLAKISYSLVSMNVPQAILKGVMQPYFQWAQAFRGQWSVARAITPWCLASTLTLPSIDSGRLRFLTLKRSIAWTE